MPNFRIIVHGMVNASSEAFAKTDIEQALTGKARIGTWEVLVSRERAECVGSGHPATHVTVAFTPDMPYNMGRCSACGLSIPLYSQGEFEVIRHFAANALKAPE